MSQTGLTKTNDDKVVKGSLQDIAAQRGIALAETLIDVDYVAVVDVSYSMSNRDGEGGASRWDMMYNALKNLQAANPGKWAVVEFSSTISIVPTGTPRQPDSSTNLAGALDFVLPFDGLAQIFVISDGQPDAPDLAIKMAHRFTHKINVICVAEAAGSDFMNELAAATGGITIPIKEASSRLITEGIKLLMEGAR